MIELIHKNNRPPSLGDSYLFFNGKYYFSLTINWIRDGWDSNNKFAVNQPSFMPKDKELFYKMEYVTSEEINEQIKLVRKHLPELLL